MRASISIFVCLAVTASVAAVGCSSSTTENTTDGGTTTPTPDSGSPADTGGGSNPSDSSAGGDTKTCTFPQGVSTGDATCDACVKAQCCDPVAKCFGDPQCANLNDCIAGCHGGKDPDGGQFDAADTDGGFSTCIDACLGSFPATAANELVAQDTCINQTCASSCPAP